MFHPSTYDLNPRLIWIGPHHIRAKGQIRNCNILRCAICASYLPTNQPLLHPGPDLDPQNLPNHPHHHFPTEGKTTLRAAPLNGLKTHNPAAATLFCFLLKSSFGFKVKFSTELYPMPFHGAFPKCFCCPDGFLLHLGGS